MSLGRHSEKNCSALEIARDRLIPDAMAAGKEKVDKGDKKKRKVQGKVRTKVLLEEAIYHQTIIENMMQNNTTYPQNLSVIIHNLTSDDLQFKKEPIEK